MVHVLRNSLRRLAISQRVRPSLPVKRFQLPEDDAGRVLLQLGRVELDARSHVADLGPLGRFAHLDEAGTIASTHPNLRRLQHDLDGDWTRSLSGARFQTVFVLDVLEHLKSPELAAQRIFSVMIPDGRFFASTGNIAFWAVRLVLLLGHFNYGRRGILDLTHTRLFTISSFRRLPLNAGFRVDSVRCFGPPVEDLVAGESKLLRLIDRVAALLARHWKSLFAYQILIEAARPESVETLMEQTCADRRRQQAGGTSSGGII